MIYYPIFFNERFTAMKYTKVLILGLAIAVLATGCSSSSTTGGNPNPGTNNSATTGTASKEVGKKAEHTPHGEGPNGGVTFDLGKYHAELTVQHDTKEITVIFLKEVSGKKEKDWPLEPVAAKELLLTTKESSTKEGKVVPVMTIKLLPKDEKDGKAAKFVGTDAGLANVADFEGTVVGEIDGKPSQGKFKE